MDRWIGRMLGDFRILGLIGQGATSRVYHALQVSLDRPVALKVFQEGLLTPGDLTERFVREARYLARLEHPHILPVYGAGQDGDVHYIALRKVEGTTLEEWLATKGARPEVLPRFLEIADALAFVHAQGGLHRDLKPSNVMIERGRAILTDFGLARLAEDSTITQSGARLGTPLYMSPEQARRERATPRSDVFSFGVMLQEALTGRHPFLEPEEPGSDTEVRERVARRIVEGERATLDGSGLSPEVRAFLDACLCTDPAGRYQDAVALRDALTRAVRGEGATPASAAAREAVPTLILPLQDDTATTSPVRPSPEPPKGRPFDRYTLREELGHGAMGVVYRAWDPTLSRDVALKVMRGGEFASQGAIERFRREASAVARMGKHPNVVTLYELGEVDGVSYFSMELVDGNPLAEVLEEGTMAFPQAATLLETVARALHFAHGHGIVHRDVKPHNILIGKDGEPQVTDFGLARDVRGGERLSMTGEVMGTPAYMSPEQARGDVNATDARTDVYALGAILYEVLTGSAPHDGSSIELILDRILRGEIVPPRRLRPGLPRELETICMKCLALQPEGRYTTAEAVADDLGRWRRGEPILARPSSLVEKACKRVRRNPLVSGLVAALLLASGVVGGVTWRSWAQERQAREERAGLVGARLRELAQSAKAHVNAALARRAMGDLKGARAFAAELDRPIEELIRLDDSLAEPWFHRGRMQRALGMDDAAEEDLGRAIDRAATPGATSDSRAVLAPARYERGVVRAVRCLRMREERAAELLRVLARSTGDGSTVPPRPDPAEIESAYPEVAASRIEALEDLQAARGAKGIPEAAARGWVELLSDVEPDVVECSLRAALEEDAYRAEVIFALGALAMGRGRPAEAAEWYERGRQGDRGHLPFFLAAARSHHLAAIEELRTGGDAQTPLRAAEAAIEDAVRGWPQDPDVWGARADHFENLAAVLVFAGQDIAAASAEILRSAEQALDLDPRNTDALTSAGGALGRMAIIEANAGMDPAVLFQAALDRLNAALRLDPFSLSTLLTRSLLCRDWADWKEGVGQDPRELFREALLSADSAVALYPRSAEARLSQGNANREIGDWKALAGQDPSADYAAGIASIRQVLAGRPRHLLALLWHARGMQSQGDWRAQRGEDPLPDFRRCIEECSKVLAIDSRCAEARLVIAGARLAIGVWRRQSGEDPLEDLASAREILALARESHSVGWRIAYAQGQVHQETGQWKASIGQDPSSDLRSAITSYDEVLRVASSYQNAIYGRSIALALLGDWEGGHGRDPAALYREAKEGYERILARTEGCLPAVRSLGRLHVTLGTRLAQGEGDPSAEFAAARECFDRNAARGSTCDEDEECMGDLHLAVARWKVTRATDAQPAFDQAVRAYERALAMSPTRVSVSRRLGGACRELGEWRRANGKDPLPAFDRSVTAYDRALELEPRNASSWNNRSLALRFRGEWTAAHGGDPVADWRGALEGYARALELRPSLAFAANNGASVHWLLGEWELAHGMDPAPSYERARAGFARALEIDARYAKAARNLGDLELDLAEKGRDAAAGFVRALAAYDKGVDIDASDAHCHRGRGAALIGLGRIEEAVTALEEALRLKPNDAKAKELLDRAREGR